MKTANAYILENPAEAKRLELQLDHPFYRLEDEFGKISIKPKSRVLDVGCGTGMATRYLAKRFPSAQIEGCDISALRLKEAQGLSAASSSSIRYFESTVEALQAPEQAYDTVVSRYVFEHLADPILAAREIFRVLKPDGEAVIVDFDGLMFNLFPMSDRLYELVQAFLPLIPVDLYVGRKIPSILGQAGFTSITWEVQANSVHGAALQAEREICAQRIAFAMPSIIQALGSETSAREFEKLYLKEMMQPNATLFCNKFIVKARR